MCYCTAEDHCGRPLAFVFFAWESRDRSTKRKTGQNTDMILSGNLNKNIGSGVIISLQYMLGQELDKTKSCESFNPKHILLHQLSGD
jgi:hypothetical protein